MIRFFNSLLGLTATVIGQPFITTWKTDNPGVSATNQIQFEATGANYTIAWEEVGNPGNNGTLTGNSVTTITFPSIGTYKVSISPGAGTFSYISSQGDPLKLLSIDQWGSIVWSSMNASFQGCSNMTYHAVDVPNLSAVTDMSSMFRFCHLFNGNIGNWNTSSVTLMTSLFESDSAFNQNIGSWNTANVVDMSYMFRGAASFNQPIGSWNTGSCYTMAVMFEGAIAFNQNIGSWNTAGVVDMSYMFSEATSFNQPIGSWNTGNCHAMNAMFQGAAAFNQDIGSWNTGNVTDMSAMFSSATSFNQPIGSWNTGNCTSMRAMFQLASAFNQNIGSWNVSSVVDMGYMFNFATNFNQNIGSWTLNSFVLLDGLLNFCGMSCTNYDSTLIGWNNNPLTPNGKSLEAFGLTYWNGQSARTNLVTVKGWIIFFDAFECGCGADADMDGTIDCDDDCPSDPLKTTPGQCGCGTPDTDTDMDGTANCNDDCPNDPLKTDPGTCGCGIGDTDSDMDGTANCDDGCPNDPLKTEPGICGCGVADTDFDMDGTANCDDDCPNDPLKTTPGDCGCGVADTDTDEDGLSDCIDACPSDPTNTCNDSSCDDNIMNGDEEGVDCGGSNCAPCAAPEAVCGVITYYVNPNAPHYNGPGNSDVWLVPASVLDAGSVSAYSDADIEVKRNLSNLTFDWTTNGACEDLSPNGGSLSQADKGIPYRDCYPATTTDFNKNKLYSLRITDGAGSDECPGTIKVIPQAPAFAIPVIHFVIPAGGEFLSMARDARGEDVSPDVKSAISELYVMPNPGHNELRVRWNSGITEDVTIRITDVSGRTLIVQHLNSMAGENDAMFDMHSTAEGIYIVSVLTTETITSVKWIKH